MRFFIFILLLTQLACSNKKERNFLVGPKPQKEKNNVNNIQLPGPATPPTENQLQEELTKLKEKIKKNKLAGCAGVATAQYGLIPENTALQLGKELAVSEVPAAEIKFSLKKILLSQNDAFFFQSSKETNLLEELEPGPLIKKLSTEEHFKYLTEFVLDEKSITHLFSFKEKSKEYYRIEHGEQFYLISLNYPWWQNPVLDHTEAGLLILYDVTPKSENCIKEN